MPFSRLCRTLLAASLLSLLPWEARAADGRLHIVLIDVEGGQATLFVAPDGHSLLIDTGWPGNNFRDADRIAKAAHDLGVQKIDDVLITHFHEDHVGGVQQLVQRIPVGTLIDHGENREMDPNGFPVKAYPAYRKLLAEGHYGHLVMHAGDVLPIQGFEAKVISADGATIEERLPGGGYKNPFCPAAPPTADVTENSRSLGIEVRFGKLRILDLGDLTRDKEYQLMCPLNRLGTVDILIVSHHGWEQSSSPALVNALQPRVALMDNGAKKGGSLPVLDTIRAAPRLETLWQLHFSEEGGAAHNTDAQFIANPQGADAGYSLNVVAEPGGGFQVINTRTSYKQSYRAR